MTMVMIPSAGCMTVDVLAFVEHPRDVLPRHSCIASDLAEEALT